nr:putative reverse transcriptase domain-containing protein [Tanacetum cinerariifolium]
MSFGITNAPTVFNDLMKRVCKSYLEKFFIVFIDDMLIYSKSKEDHEVHLKLVLEMLKKEKLFTKFSMYEFWLQEVRFLGHGGEQEEAFQTLKDNFCNAPILSLPDGPEDFVVYCDAKERVKSRRVRAMSMTIQSCVKDKILHAQSKTSRVENTSTGMLKCKNIDYGQGVSIEVHGTSVSG